MKRNIVALAALMTISTAAFAQDDNQQQQQRPPKMDRTEMMKMQTERMTKELNLTDAQKTQVQALNEKYADKMGPMGGGPGGPRGPRGGQRPQKDAQQTDATTGATQQKRPELTDEQKQKMDAMMKEHRAAREAYETELKGILTEDQFKTYQTNQKQRRGGPRRGKRPQQQNGNEK